MPLADEGILLTKPVSGEATPVFNGDASDDELAQQRVAKKLKETRIEGEKTEDAEEAKESAKKDINEEAPEESEKGQEKTTDDKRDEPKRIKRTHTAVEEEDKDVESKSSDEKTEAPKSPSVAPPEPKKKIFGSGSAFGGGASAASPFGALTSNASPFGALSSSASPFASLASGKSPFASGASSSNASPFGSSTALSGFGAYAGQSAFGKVTTSVSPSKKPKTADGEDENDDNKSGEEEDKEQGEKKDGGFSSMLENVKDEEKSVKTGEEEETTVYNSKAKLFSFDTKEQAWKERGVGTLRVNLYQDKKLGGRIVMRADAVYRVILNVKLFKNMKIETSKDAVMNEKSIRFSALEEGKLVMFTVRVGNANTALDLAKAITDSLPEEAKEGDEEKENEEESEV
ncbi:PH domain-like protein [Saitoella complicata NRRL Y-17804]|uniref:PH domain-like protein n=1 Tax=Saitoella complicata (strain BCRC 22490 / CBS 7301 / JCM 7358 / NBRC 10748 / NRRL Y-17804) TaxID=698492 RepID=UPI0008672DAA|nr:PH domain-like protein [Saitoella complicata NRRL Y-17804]ODQ51563.1 PH domain-like protein [Saitoella complicata NRRL Y-17804]